MKTKFLAVLLAIGLITPSLYAQRALRGLKNAGNAVRSLERGSYNIVKMPHIDIKPSLSTRVSAAVRGQTPALKRLQRIQENQAYRGLVQEWGERNKSLAEQLDFRGVILTKLPSNGKMVDAFSADGVTWFEADDMLVKAVKDSRFVRIDEASGAVRFSLYKDGPEFEFYDEQLFKELDRSRELGMNIINRNGYVTVQFPKEFAETEIMFGGEVRQLQEISTNYMASYKHVVWIRNSEGKIESALYTPQEVVEPGMYISKKQGGFVETIGVDGQSVKELNDWYASFKDLAAKLKPYEGRFNIHISLDATGGFRQLMLRDSRGVLHEPKDFEAVIRAEKELSLPAVRVETPKIEVPVEVDFEEVL